MFSVFLQCSVCSDLDWRKLTCLSHGRACLHSSRELQMKRFCSHTSQIDFMFFRDKRNKNLKQTNQICSLFSLLMMYFSSVYWWYLIQAHEIQALAVWCRTMKVNFTVTVSCSFYTNIWLCNVETNQSPVFHNCLLVDSQANIDTLFF